MRLANLSLTRDDISCQSSFISRIQALLNSFSDGIMFTSVCQGLLFNGATGGIWIKYSPSWSWKIILCCEAQVVQLRTQPFVDRIIPGKAISAALIHAPICLLYHCYIRNVSSCMVVIVQRLFERNDTWLPFCLLKNLEFLKCKHLWLLALFVPHIYIYIFIYKTGWLK